MADARTLLVIGFVAGWLVFSLLTLSVVCDSTRRQGRPINRKDRVAILAGPLFWLQCVMEATRQAREATADSATPAPPSDPVKPDYQPGDVIVLFPATPNGKTH